MIKLKLRNSFYLPILTLFPGMIYTQLPIYLANFSNISLDDKNRHLLISIIIAAYSVGQIISILVPLNMRSKKLFILSYFIFTVGLVTQYYSS